MLHHTGWNHKNMWRIAKAELPVDIEPLNWNDALFIVIRIYCTLTLVVGPRCQRTVLIKLARFRPALCMLDDLFPTFRLCYKLTLLCSIQTRHLNTDKLSYYIVVIDRLQIRPGLRIRRHDLLKLAIGSAYMFYPPSFGVDSQSGIPLIDIFLISITNDPSRPSYLYSIH